MLRPRIFVGFTGHRRLADPAMIAQRIQEGLDVISGQSRRPLAAVSSAAIGADTLFIQAVQQRKIPWTLLLPFPATVFANEDDFPLPTDRDTFHELAAKAAHIHVDPGFKPDRQSPESRENGFLECGLRTVEECDVLLAVWDGLEPRGLGGTGRIVTYARELGKPVLWIHAVSGAPATERFDHLTSEEPSPHLGKVDESLAPLEQMEQMFRHFDDNAVSNAPYAKYLTMGVVSLHQCATAIGIVGLMAVSFADTASQIKVAALIAAVVVPRLFHHRQTEWMHHRLCAELCRSARAIWPLPHPTHTFAALRLPTFEWLQRSLLLLRLSDLGPTPRLETVKTNYAEQRIQDQLGHFARKAKTAKRNGHWAKRAALACTALSIAFGIAVLWPAHDHHDPLYLTAKALSLCLPLVAAALLSAVTSLDMDRRAARYGELEKALREANTRLQARVTWEGLNTVVIEVERMLLLEIWEWYSVSRYSASH